MSDDQHASEDRIPALRAGLDERLAARDRGGAVALALEAVRSGVVDVESLYVRVLVPLLVDTGARWQQGTVSVWEEHFATATVRTVVEALYPEVVTESKARPRLGKTAVLACPAGEQHDLGLRMLADRMQLAGWDVYYLGADTPVGDIVAAAASVEADLVALTAATHYNLVLTRSVLDELVRRLPGVRIAVGGPGVRCAPDWPADHLLTEESLGLSTTTDPVCEG